MKTKIILFLQKLPSQKEEIFNQAFALLSKTPGVNPVFLRNYNMLGATDANIANVLYDLKKFNAITDVMIKSKIITKKTDEGLGNIATPSSVKTPNTDSDQTKKSSLREEFPFLNDENCMPELYIISGELIASYNRYEGHMKRIDAFKLGELELSPDEDLELTAKSVAEFENNQALYRELEFYRDNSKLLAEHPILKKYRWKKQFESMTADEKFRYKNNAKAYISKFSPEVASDRVAEDRKAKLQEKISEREYIVALIDVELAASK